MLNPLNPRQSGDRQAQGNRPGTRRKRRVPPSPKQGMGWNELTTQRVEYCLNRDAGWVAEARTSLRYYGSDQYRFTRRERDNTKARMVVNYIRSDVDRMSSTILDAQLDIMPMARQARWFPQAQAVFQYLEYSKEHEEEYKPNIQRAIRSSFQIGEGAVQEGWDQWAMNGLGFCKTQRVDSRRLLVDPHAKELQKDDAAFVISMEMVGVEELKKVYRKRDVQPESWEKYMPVLLVDHWRQRSQAIHTRVSGQMDELEDRAWLIRMWHKEFSYETRYVRDGEFLDLTEEQYRQLPEEAQAEIMQLYDRVEYLWELVQINDQIVSHELSPFDRSQGGHGMYPFGWFHHVLIDDEPRARGEIGFLIGISDVTNEAHSMMLDHAWISNAGYMHVEQGSLPPDQEDKLPFIGARPFPVIKTRPGTPPPEWRGTSPVTVQTYQQMLPLLERIHNRESSSFNASRGQIDFAGQSGKLARYLQAASDRSLVITRQQIESALRRLNLMRLHNLAQFTRASMVAQVVDKESGAETPLYIGQSLDEIMGKYQLRPSQDPQSGQAVLLDTDNTPAKVLVLNEDLRRSKVLEKIRLQMDTDRRANKAERLELAQYILQTVGAPAVPWAAREMEVSNMEVLIGDIERSQVAEQMYEQLADIAKRMGVEPDEILRRLAGYAQQAGQGGGTQARPQGGPQGLQAPGGAPQGGPQLQGGTPQGSLQPAAQAASRATGVPLAGTLA